MPDADGSHRPTFTLKQLLNMKKIIALILTAAAVTAGAQTNNQAAQLAELAAAITIQVTPTADARIYTVTVPNEAAGVLTGAQRTGETENDYVRRAFLAGAVSLINQRNALAARSASLAAQIDATQAKAAADAAQIQTAAAARVATLTNQLNAVNSALK